MTDADRVFGTPDEINSGLAVAAAVGAGATVGVVRGTWAVGGSDSSCYALMADAFADGPLQPSSPARVRGAVAGRSADAGARPGSCRL